MHFFLVALLFVAACGNGAGGSPRGAGGEFEQRRGADVERARQLYADGRKQEGAAILRDLAANDNWNVRSDAIRTIGAVQDRDLLPVVHTALQDKSPEVRESAGRVLISLGDRSSLAPLHEALSDQTFIVRMHAAEALLTIAGVEELGTVRDLIEKDSDPTVRAHAARVLAGVRDPAVVPILISALGDESAMVRGEAADSLGAVGFASGRAALEKAAKSDPDAGVRDRAAAALQRISG
jgi:HEAT repeat protein